MLNFSLRFSESSYEIICLSMELFAFLIQFLLLKIKKDSMGAIMLNTTSINGSFSKPMGVCKGALKVDKNDLSPAVLKI